MSTPRIHDPITRTPNELRACADRLDRQSQTYARWIDQLTRQIAGGVQRRESVAHNAQQCVWTAQELRDRAARIEQGEDPDA